MGIKLSQRRNALPFDIFVTQKAQESVDFSFGLEKGYSLDIVAQRIFYIQPVDAVFEIGE